MSPSSKPRPSGMSAPIPRASSQEYLRNRTHAVAAQREAVEEPLALVHEDVAQEVRLHAPAHLVRSRSRARGHAVVGRSHSASPTSAVAVVFCSSWIRRRRGSAAGAPSSPRPRESAAGGPSRARTRNVGSTEPPTASQMRRRQNSVSCGTIVGVGQDEVVVRRQDPGADLRVVLVDHDSGCRRRRRRPDARRSSAPRRRAVPGSEQVVRVEPRHDLARRVAKAAIDRVGLAVVRLGRPPS